MVCTHTAFDVFLADNSYVCKYFVKSSRLRLDSNSSGIVKVSRIFSTGPALALRNGKIHFW